MVPAHEQHYSGAGQTQQPQKASMNEQLPVSRDGFFERLESMPVVDGRLALNNAADVWRFSKIIKSSGLARKELSESDVFLIILNGIRLRLDPLEAIASSYIVNGR